MHLCALTACPPRFGWLSDDKRSKNKMMYIKKVMCTSEPSLTCTRTSSSMIGKACQAFKKQKLHKIIIKQEELGQSYNENAGETSWV